MLGHIHIPPQPEPSRYAITDATPHPTRPAVGPWIVRGPLLIYAVSFLLPISNEGDTLFWGWQVFFLSFLAWPIGWCANPVFWIALFCLDRGRWLWALGLGVVSVLLGLTCLPIAVEIIGSFWHVAYFVWLGSLVVATYNACRLGERQASQSDPETSI